MQQDDTISFASAEKAACGQVCCKTAPLVQAAPLCCKTPFLPLVTEAVMGIFLTTLAFHPLQSGVFVSHQRKEVIFGGVPSQLVPWGI